MYKYISYSGKTRVKNYGVYRIKRLSLKLRTIIAAVTLLIIVAVTYLGMRNEALSLFLDKLHHELVNNYKPEYKITGLTNYAPAELFECAGMLERTQIVSPAQIKNNVETNCGFVKKARVRLILPHKWLIDIEEKSPAVIWRHNQKFILLDEAGTRIKIGVSSTEKRQYIVIFGDNADQHFAPLLKLLRSVFEEYEQIATMHYLNQRRWNIFLENGTLIKLPEQDYIAALKIWSSVSKQRKVKELYPKTIDLRLTRRNKIFIEPR